MKNSRKAKQYYTLLNRDGREVSIDLNNYKVTCTVTGSRKGFYHKYLYNLIISKYAGNIDTFRETYTSREAKRVDQTQRKLDNIHDRITRAYDLIAQLKEQKQELVRNAPWPFIHNWSWDRPGELLTPPGLVMCDAVDRAVAPDTPGVQKNDISVLVFKKHRSHAPFFSQQTHICR